MLLSVGANPFMRVDEIVLHYATNRCLTPAQLATFPPLDDFGSDLWRPTLDQGYPACFKQCPLMRCLLFSVVVGSTAGPQEHEEGYDAMVAEGVAWDGPQNVIEDLIVSMHLSCMWFMWMYEEDGEL